MRGGNGPSPSSGPLSSRREKRAALAARPARTMDGVSSASTPGPAVLGPGARPGLRRDEPFLLAARPRRLWSLNVWLGAPAGPWALR